MRWRQNISFHFIFPAGVSYKNNNLYGQVADTVAAAAPALQSNNQQPARLTAKLTRIVGSKPEGAGGGSRFRPARPD